MDSSSLVDALPLRYRVEECLSCSETGATLTVLDTGLRGALAVLKGQKLRREENDLFLEFCERLSAVRDANIATPYTYGTVRTSSGTLYGYTTREFVAGRALSELEVPLGADSVSRAAVQICKALEALHARGLIHHDIKLENVIVRRVAGQAIDELAQCVLIDFSYRDCAAAGQRALNEVTLQYVAPELLAGADPAPSTDLYSLGVLLYSLLTGQRPFRGRTVSEIIAAQRDRSFEPIASVLSGTQLPLYRTVERLLEPYPENRPATAEELYAEFGETLSGPQQVTSLFTGFVGRAAELAQCEKALDGGSAACVEVVGGPRTGVTTFLRELQDRLESRGALVLTARPRRICGERIQDQLLVPLNTLVRRSCVGPGRLPSESTTDLLDDFLVATEGRRVVLFVDDWHECEPSELSLIRRLVLQDAAVRTESPREAGRCQLVLGATAVVDRACPEAEGVARSVDERVELGPWTRSDIQRLLGSSNRPELLSPACYEQLRKVAGTQPGTVVEILNALVGMSRCTPDDVDAAFSALPAASLRTDRQAREEIAGVVADRDGRALLALGLWGEWLPRDRWVALRREMGCGIEETSSRWLQLRDDGAEVRLARPHLCRYISDVLGSELQDVERALFRVLQPEWMSRSVRTLHCLLKLVARVQRIPKGLRWSVVRALMMLSRAGRFAEVSSVGSDLGRVTDGRLGAWVEMIRLGSLVESGVTVDTDAIESAVRATKSRLAPAYGYWMRARSLWRRRRRSEACRWLEKALASESGRTLAGGAVLLDAALLHSETGAAQSARRHRRGLLRYFRRLVAGCGIVGSRILRVRARLLRARHRDHLASGHCRRAARCAEHEFDINVALEDRLGQAASLNNLGIARLRAGQVSSAIEAFEECARRREALDDERGLVAVLNNLALAHTQGGSIGNAAGALNRARVVASRNGLTRHALLSTLHLGLAYVRNGQLREAQRLFGRLIARSRRASDRQTQARATINYALLALDSWHLGASKRLLDRARALNNEHGLRGLPIVEAGVELAIRCGQVGAIREFASETGNELAISALAAFEGEDVPKRARSEVRARALALRVVLGHKRVRIYTARRLARVMRSELSSRLVLECAAAHFRSPPSNASESLRFGWEILADPSLRAGHDDLQIVLRARMARVLLGVGRQREAWALIQEGLWMFRKLERKLRGASPGEQVLWTTHRELCQIVGLRSRSNRRQPLSAVLESHAFRALASKDDSWFSSGSGPDVVAEIADALAHTDNQQELLDRLLSVAVAATGAHRAVLVRTVDGEKGIVGATIAGEDGPHRLESMDISWAVVSKVMDSGVPAIYDDALAAEQLSSHRSIAVLNLRSLACVPLRDSAGIVGALYVDHHGMAGLFSEQSLNALLLIVSLIGSGMDCASVRAAAADWELKLAEAHRQLVRAERNRLAGQIASGLAHDLKNVLTTIVARSQLLRRKDTLEAGSLRSIESAAQSAVGLIERLQECSREHVLQRESEFDIRDIVTEALDLLAPRLSDGAGIRVSASLATGARLRAVPGEIRELFLNLFVNACDAMPEGGTLSISVHALGDEAVVEVADTGVGMTDDVQGRIFEPFFTTKGSDGTGLGLAVTKSVVVRHAGRISVKSQVGHGTCFTIALPLVPSSAVVQRKATKKPTS